MGLVRKYLAWIILGVAFATEAVGLYFVLGSQGTAEEEKKSLEAAKADRRTKEAQAAGIDARIEVYKARNEAVRRELGDCLLFLWHREQRYEQLFDSKELAADEVAPWITPSRFEVFRARYQDAYNVEADKLDPKMRAVGTDRGALGLADPIGFMQPTVTIGDMYAEQKEFWIKKELVEMLHDVKTEAEAARKPPPPVRCILSKVDLGGGVSSRRKELPHVHGPVSGKLFEPIPVELQILCDYRDFHRFLEKLLASGMCFRLDGIRKVERVLLPEGRAIPGAGGPGAVPAALAGDEPPEQGPELVSVSILGEVADIALDIQQVIFARDKFKDRAAALDWLDKELRSVNQRLASSRDAREKNEKQGSAGAKWVADQLKKAEEALKNAPAGKPVPILIEDDLAKAGWDEQTKAERRRQYGFADAKWAREWLKSRYDYEVHRLEAMRDLWTRVRRLVEAGKADDKSPAGVVVTFRPPEQFDKGQMHDQPFDPEGKVMVHFGLVTFKPKLGEGVKRATSTLTPTVRPRGG